MANENGTVGSNQRRAVIGRRISGGASSSPIVSPALGTTSEPARSATVSAEPEPIKETPKAQENMASITDYSSADSASAEPRSDAIGDGGAGGGLGQGMNTMQNRDSLDNSFSSGGLNSTGNGPSLNNPYPQQGGLPKQQEYQQPPQGNAYQQQSYQQPPQGNVYQQQGYQQPPQGNAYQQQAYQQPPQGNAYQQQAYQQPPQGNAYQQQYQQPPQGNAYQQQSFQQPPQENAYQQQAYQQPPQENAYQQSPPQPEMPVSKPEQMAYGEPATQPMTRTEREAELPPPSPVPQVTRPVVQREEVVSNPNPTIGSYLASKESDGGDDLYSLLNGMGKESKLEKRKTMKELASGLLGGKKKKPKEV